MFEVDNDYYFWPFCGTIASSMAYTVVITLYYSCFRGLVKRAPSFSTRRRRFMFIYITFLLVLTTCSIFQEIYTMTATLFYPELPQSFFLIGSWDLDYFESPPPLLVLSIWAVDGFMVILSAFCPPQLWSYSIQKIWRCFVLYQNTSAGYRRMAIGLLCLISLTSLGAGLTFFIGLPGYFIASISGFSNILLSLLIVCRLLYHQKNLRRVLGVSHGKVYTRIITICIESCALITFFMAAYSIMYATGCPGHYFALFLLPHICVISALMLVRRVAQGIESTTTIPPPSGGVYQPVLARVEENIRFVNPVSTGVMQESV